MDKIILTKGNEIMSNLGWQEMWNKVESMLPEEKIRWLMENECTCHVVEGWWDYRNHFANCPLENPNADMWAFYEGVEDGFIYPK